MAELGWGVMETNAEAGLAPAHRINSRPVASLVLF
jgi:hypothetical protein